MSHNPTRPVEGVANTEPVGLRVVVEVEGVAPRVLFIARDQTRTLGRGAECDVVLPDDSHSRRHLSLSFDGVRATAKDLGSRNGTWLDGKRITEPTTLGVGDQLRVGSTTITVVRVIVEGPVATDAAMDLELGVIASAPRTIETFRLLTKLAKSSLPVLLLGETGSGKEVAARALHRASRRATGPFVAINCATLVESLAESELFGHEKGAFTGAASRRIGAFESAHGGTLLLDEVGELSLPNQARLLRALQERKISRVGSVAPITVDVRVIAATHRDLAAAVSARTFREDLYFRLNGASVTIPPLRERTQDVLPLVAQALSGRSLVLGEGVERALFAYRWPGNVRELLYAIEHAAALTEGDTIEIDSLPASVRGLADSLERAREGSLDDQVEESERRAIVAALAKAGNNQTHAAKTLGISRRALIYRMERLGLKPPPG